ncbi:MAG: enoyl-CoA hydratase/isomerase family protein [Chloroflexota bacterium]
MATEFPTLILESSDRTAHVRLNRPEVLNAFNMQMRDDFSQVLDFLEASEGLDVVVISGQGRAFCAGADLTEFGTSPSPVMAREIRHRRDVWDRLRRLPQVLVAAIHGYCLGSGLELACLADLRLAEEGTQFAFPEMKLGMIPAAGGTQTFPRVLRANAALDLILTGERFDAPSACRLGLLTELVPSGQLALATAQLIQRLLRHAPQRLRTFKRLVGAARELGASATYQAEHTAFSAEPHQLERSS